MTAGVPPVSACGYGILLLQTELRGFERISERLVRARSVADIRRWVLADLWVSSRLGWTQARTRMRRLVAPVLS